MKSRFASTCQYCDRPINRGDDIERGPRGYGHVTCVNGVTTAPQTTAPAFSPSQYQTAIFDFVENGGGNAVVEAVAGSGKTTTLVRALEYTPTDQSVAFVAFNRHIAQELGRRAPSHVQTSTLHSLGLKTIQNALGRVKVDDHKLDSLLDDFDEFAFLNDAEKARRYARRSAAKRVVSLLKGTLTDAEPASVQALCDRHNVDLNDDADVILAHLPDILSACAEDLRRVDFDDMLWLPHRLGLQPEQFDWVFADEAQDFNAAQQSLLLAAASGRVVAVGDRHQAIYGWAGADTDSIPNLIGALSAGTLPLSISYRCPASHVRLAQQFVSHLEARPGAPEGVLGYVKESELSPQDGDMLLCRVNAPLVGLAFRLIRKGIKATVRGRDIGKNLADFARRIGEAAATVDVFLNNLTDYQAKESRRLVIRKASDTQLAALEDKCETLAVVASECQTVEEIGRRIEAIFSDEIAGVVLSSVHRAKGLEAERVYILKPDLLPFPKAKQEWEVQQERNVTYVAYTRSKSELFFVEE